VEVNTKQNTQNRALDPTEKAAKSNFIKMNANIDFDRDEIYDTGAFTKKDLKPYVAAVDHLLQSSR
jgi:hypothetical protein